MPDYIRIGPPYGQVNQLLRPFVPNGFINGMAEASADVARYGNHWGADNWYRVPSNINPDVAQASWAVASGLNDASNFANFGGYGVGGWTIYAATAMPPSAIIARATVMLPFAATAMMVFEMIGAATFAAFPVVPEFVPANASTLVASAQGSVIGSFLPAAVGSAQVAGIARAYQQNSVQFSPMTVANGLLMNRVVTIQIRTVGSVASGAQLYIGWMRLSTLPVPNVGTTAGPLASAAIAQASSLVGTIYFPILPGANTAMFTGKLNMSPIARYPAMPTTDAQQPNGYAVEIGSTTVAGQVEWGSDLVQKNYAQSLLTPGDPLAFERIPNRSMKFPYINSNPSNNAHIFTNDVANALKPGNVIDVVPEALTTSSRWVVNRFDIVDGRVVYTEDVRYARAGLARGTIEAQTLPYARWASAVSVQVMAAFATSPSSMFVKGEVPAPAFVSIAPNGNATAGSGVLQYAGAKGFISTLIPDIPTYFPFPMNMTAVNTVASIGNSFRGAGSQVFINMSNATVQRIAFGYINPEKTDAIAGRARVFAVAANASTATIPLYMTTRVGVSQVATSRSNVGFVTPLYTTASELPQLGYVDLGEIRIPIAPNALNGTVTWEIWCATGASSNATAGIFDSFFMLPTGDSRTWLGVMPSTNSPNTQNFQQVIVTASNALTLDSSFISGGGADVLLQNWLKSNVVDVTSMYQGRAPYVYPGFMHGWTAQIGISNITASFSRPYTVASGNSGLTGMLVHYWPRFLFTNVEQNT